MSHKLYLDESGDLGWTFDKPFRNGGSSRFLTIAYLVVPDNSVKICNRFVKEIYTLLNVNHNVELKATSMDDDKKKLVAGKIIRLLNAQPDFVLGAITVKKDEVNDHIRTDGNQLYNYMIGQSILEKVKSFTEVDLIRDSRSVKVKSGNSCIDYLKIRMAFDFNSATKLTDYPTESHTEFNLMLIDWVANFIWSNYEDGKNEPFTRLSPRLANQTLYF